MTSRLLAFTSSDHDTFFQAATRSYGTKLIHPAIRFSKSWQSLCVPGILIFTNALQLLFFVVLTLLLSSPAPPPLQALPAAPVRQARCTSQAKPKIHYTLQCVTQEIEFHEFRLFSKIVAPIVLASKQQLRFKHTPVPVL